MMTKMKQSINNSIFSDHLKDQAEEVWKEGCFSPVVTWLLIYSGNKKENNFFFFFFLDKKLSLKKGCLSSGRSFIRRSNVKKEEKKSASIALAFSTDRDGH